MSAFESVIRSEPLALEDTRPALRGFLHAGALVAAIAGAVVLLLLADSTTEYVGAAIFGTSLILLYSSSTTYHRLVWNTSLRRVGKRFDHAMIFVLIGGTYTPFCLDVSLSWGIPMLSVVWSVAGVGILLKIIWPDAPKWLSVAAYIGLGWVALVATKQLVDSYPAGALTMLALGGALYTVGALIYAVQRPDPWPRVFGYHEIFHAMVVAASAMHYALIVAYVLN